MSNLYQFTAFQENDLGGSIGSGSTFTMPGLATVCITVDDDDQRLSGDKQWNEESDDTSLQTAQIERDGVELGNGGQIYAEVFFWVTDENGNTYRLIEIEQEGANGFDLFVFDTSFGIPPAGAQLTVGSAKSIPYNGWEPDLTQLGVGPKDAPDPSDPDCIIYEAEDMVLNGFKVGWGSQASEGEFVKLKSAGGWGEISQNFDGAAGTYDLTWCIQDESDGQSPIKVKVNGVVVAEFILNGDNNGGGSDDSGFSEFTLENIQLNPGDEISLEADGDCWEWVRVDKLVLKPVDVPPADPDCIIIEAEAFALTNFQVVDGDQASGGQLVKISSHWGEISTDFGGASGTYDLSLFVQDESDGQSHIKVKVNGVVVAEFDLTADSDGGGSNHGGFSEIKLDGIAINQGDSIEIEADKNGGEYVRIDKVVLKPVDVPPVDPECIVIEAETFDLTNFQVVDGDQASGGQLVKISSHWGEISTDFGGASGNYDLSLFIQDESDGQSHIKVKVNGVVVAAFDLNADSDGGGSNHSGFSEITLDDIAINQGDTIEIEADKDGGEYVRIDKIVLKPAADPEFRICDDPDAVNIDFEGFAAGTTIGMQYDGVMISAQRDGDNPASENDAMVFDSGNPTGGDTDLATTAQGNLLIISEDNDSNDPDDNAGGGTIEFKFDDPAFIADMKFVDTEETGGTVTMFDADDNVIAVINIPAIADGGIQQVLMDVADVSRLVVDLAGSGAVDDLCYIPGAPQPGALSGTYFCDDDRDGIDDGAANGDADIAGKTVMLFEADGITPATDIDGNPVAAVLTDTSGNYSFGNLAAGDYVVMFEATDGKDFIEPNVGANDAIDSDVVDAANGKTAPVTVIAGEETTDVDAGVADPEFRVCDDPDAVNIDFEGFAAGTTIGMQYDGVMISAQRDGDNPASENDAMVFDSGNPTGGDTDLATTAQGNLLIISEDNDSNDPDDNAGGGTIEFKFDDPAFIADMKFIDTEETGGTVTMFDADDNVIAVINIPAIADGGIQQVLMDVADVSRLVVDLAGSGAIDDLCYIPGAPQPGALSGTYFCDDDQDGIDDGAANGDADIAGKTVMLFEADGITPATDIDGNLIAPIQTDAMGNYRFDNLGARDYVVMFEATDGKSFIAPNQGGDDTVDSDVIDPVNGKTDPVTVNAGEETMDVDAGVQAPGSLSGTYFCDNNGDDDDDGVAGGDGDVAGQMVMLFEADGVTPATDIDGNPIAAVMTDANGNYSFGNLGARDYVVMFAPVPGKEFVAQDSGNDDTDDSDVDPATGKTGPITVVAGQDTPDNDAGVRDLPGAMISGRYFCDQNNNGVDDGEAGIFNATIMLLDDMGNMVDSTTTAADGSYMFSDVAPGDYRVKFGPDPKGKAFTEQDVGNDDTIDSDADQITGITDLISVNFGDKITDLDAGTEFLSNIGDFVADPLLVPAQFVPLLGGFEITYDLNGAEVTTFGYCLDYDAGLPPSGPFDPDLYNVADPATGAVPSLDGVANLDDNLDNLNWLLNQKFTTQQDTDGDNFSTTDIQLAIWMLVDDKTPEFLGLGYLEDDIDDALEIYNLALLNGDGFAPGDGSAGDCDIVGVIADVGPGFQPIVIGIDADDLC